MPNDPKPELDEKTLEDLEYLHNNNPKLVAVIDALRDARQSLIKIDAIRNSIVGYQNINWSVHIYPLVAALEEVGFHGLGYEEASKLAKTQVERIAELEQQLIDSEQIRHAEKEILVKEVEDRKRD